MWAKPVLPIVSTVVWGLALVPGGLMAMTSPMIFDSGASSRTWMLFFAALAFPLLCIVSIAASWVLWGVMHGSSPAARFWSIAAPALPLLPVAVLIVLFTTSSSLT